MVQFPTLSQERTCGPIYFHRLGKNPWSNILPYARGRTHDAISFPRLGENPRSNILFQARGEPMVQYPSLGQGRNHGPISFSRLGENPCPVSFHLLGPWSNISFPRLGENLWSNIFPQARAIVQYSSLGKHLTDVLSLNYPMSECSVGKKISNELCKNKTCSVLEMEISVRNKSFIGTFL